MRHMENDCKLNYNHSTVLVSISSFISFQHAAASILPQGQIKAASHFRAGVADCNAFAVIQITILYAHQYWMPCFA
jgi:hypothetical protein